MIYIRDNLQCNELKWSPNIDLECIGLSVTLSPQMSFILLVLYRPPNSTIEFYESLNSVLKECDRKKSQCHKKEMLLMGDFNINWENRTNRKALKQVTDKFDLTQLITGPTRITTTSQTQIDLIFSNRPERVEKTLNLITGLSDHNLTLLSRKLTKKRFQNGHTLNGTAQDPQK